MNPCAGTTPPLYSNETIPIRTPSVRALKAQWCPLTTNRAYCSKRWVNGTSRNILNKEIKFTWCYRRPISYEREKSTPTHFVKLPDDLHSADTSTNPTLLFDSEEIRLYHLYKCPCHTGLQFTLVIEGNNSFTRSENYAKWGKQFGPHRQSWPKTCLLAVCKVHNYLGNLTY